MSTYVLIALAVLFVLALLEGIGIFALFRQVGLLHLALAGDDPYLAPVKALAEPLPVGSEAPHLAGTTVQGEPVSLDKLAGERVLVAFVHPLCEPCNAIAPDLEVLSHDPDLNTRVIVVSDADRISTEEYVAEHHLSVPVLYEPRSDFAQPAPVLGRFKVPRTPFAYLFDERHRVVSSGTTGGREFFWRVAKGLPETPVLGIPRPEAKGLKPAVRAGVDTAGGGAP